MQKHYLLLAVLGMLFQSNLFAQQEQSKQDSIKTVELEEISVLATKMNKRTPMAYSTLKKEEIQKSNLGQDMPYLLQMQPSVVVSSEAGTGLGYTYMRVRGVDTQGINVMVNGVPLNDSESQGVFWVNMADFAGSTSELQLQRGVGSSTNGAGAFGASLNMRTDNLSNNPYTQVNLSLGSYGTEKETVRLGTGRIKQHWSFDARLSRIKSKGYIDRATFDGLGYFIQGAYIADRTLIKVLSFGGKEKTGVAWWALDPANAKFGRTFNISGVMDLDPEGKKTTYYKDNTDNYRQIHNQLIISHKVNQELSLNFTGHYTNGFGYTEEYKRGWYGEGAKLKEYGLEEFEQNGTLVETSHLVRRKYLDNDFFGGILTVDWKADKWHIDFGLSANKYIGQHYGEIRWIKNYKSPVLPEDRYYDDEANKIDFSTFIKANYQVSNHLNAYLDLQYRHINYQIDGTYDGYDKIRKAMQEINLDTNFDFFNPKFGLLYQFSPRQNVYSSVAVAHREPNRKTFTDASVGEYPKAERLIDYELGYAYMGKVFSASANAYFMQYKDQLVLSGGKSNVGGDLVENVADSYRMGIELASNIKPCDWLNLDLTMALNKSQIKHYNYLVEDWDNGGFKSFSADNTPIAFSPSILTSGSITLSKWGGELRLSGNYIGKQHLDNTGSKERMLQDFFVANLLLTYKLPVKFVKEWRLSLQVNNLFNAEYANNAYTYTGIIKGKINSFNCPYNQAPINFLVGTSISI